MRPTKYLKKWSRVDQALAEAHLSYEASLNAHGIPRFLAGDADRTFEVDEVMDYAAEAFEQAQEEYRRADNASPGLRLIVLDKGVRESPDAPDKESASPPE